jgi:hypothetical protein
LASAPSQFLSFMNYGYVLYLVGWTQELQNAKYSHLDFFDC